MTYGMKLIDQPAQVASIELAGALLRAWVRGDRPAFEAELDRSSRTPPVHRDTGEAERLQMLSAIAGRLRTCDDPLSPDSGDLGIDVCASLLSHLACPALPPRPNRFGWTVVRSAIRPEKPDAARLIPIRLGTWTLH